MLHWLYVVRGVPEQVETVQTLVVSITTSEETSLSTF
jgi:hypothetical protein